jgi:tetratricopeptide (TPR) repeat protein
VSIVLASPVLLLALMAAGEGRALLEADPVTPEPPRRLSAAALCGRGRLLIDDERPASLVEARVLFSRVVAEDPDDACGHAGLSRVLALLYVRGIEEDDGLIDAALAAARRGVERDDASAEAHAALGRALLLDQQNSEAERAVRMALERDPSSVPALQTAAQVHAANKQHDLARETLERAVALAPQIPSIHLALGNVELLGGDDMVALEHFRDALILFPDYVPASLQMAAAIEAMGGYRDAAAILREVLEKHPEARPRAQLFMGLSLMKRSQWPEALVVLERAEFKTRRWLSGGTISYFKGVCLEEMRRGEEAVAAYRDVIDNYPGATAGFSDGERLIFRAYEALGRMRLAAGDIEGAAAEMEQGASRTGASLELALRLAGLYADYNHPAKAVAALEQAVRRPMTPRIARAQLQAYVAWARLLPLVPDPGAPARLAESLATHTGTLHDMNDTVRDLDAMRALAIAGAGPQALAWLRRATDRGYTHVAWIRDDPELESLRRAPGFDDLVASAENRPIN